MDPVGHRRSAGRGRLTGSKTAPRGLLFRVDVDPIESLVYGPTPRTTRNPHSMCAVIEGQCDAIHGRPMTVNGATLRWVFGSFIRRVLVEICHGSGDARRFRERTVVWEYIPITPCRSRLRRGRRLRRCRYGRRSGTHRDTPVRSTPGREPGSRRGGTYVAYRRDVGIYRYPPSSSRSSRTASTVSAGRSREMSPVPGS